MPDEQNSPRRWLLALESSTSHGGAALMADGEIVSVARLDEGLRHGRELMPAAAGLLAAHGIEASDLSAVAVSSGPGSYTGLRVGVMAAKALAFAGGCRLAAVSSLAAMAASACPPGTGGVVMVVQDARRDEVYAGLYRITEDGDAAALAPDVAVAPEEAAARLAALTASVGEPILAGSGFATYAALFPEEASAAAPGMVDPAAVARLGWRRILREDFADPFALQPSYLRRDAGADWTKDQLIKPL